METSFCQELLPYYPSISEAEDLEPSYIANCVFNLDSFCDSGLLFSDISDHLPVFSILSNKLDCVSSNNKWITYREKTTANVEKFRSELEHCDWERALDNVDASDAYKIFLQKFTSLYNNCFPVKRTRLNNSTLKKPWITKGLLKSIKKKNALYKRFLSAPNPTREHHYKSFRNRLTRLLRLAKREYYEKKLTEYKSNIKFTRRVLNEVINNRKNKFSILPSAFKINDSEISNPTEIANGFCTYFTGLGSSLAEKVPLSLNSFASFFYRIKW